MEILKALKLPRHCSYISKPFILSILACAAVISIFKLRLDHANFKGPFFDELTLEEKNGLTHSRIDLPIDGNSALNKFRNLVAPVSAKDALFTSDHSVYSLPFSQDMYKITHFIHILVPAMDGEEYAGGRIDSLLRQDYDRTMYRIYTYSSDLNIEIMLQARYGTEPQVQFLNSALLSSSSQSILLEALLTVRTFSTPNDVIVLMDEAKYFISDEALSILNQSFVNTKCWMIHSGIPLFEDIYELSSRLSSLWTFKAVLVDLVLNKPELDSILNPSMPEFDPIPDDGINVDVADLTTIPVSERLQRAQLILNMIDLTGGMRFQHVRMQIHDVLGKSQAKNNIANEKEVAESLLTVTRLPQHEEDVHVFLCVWGRINLLWDALSSLVREQTTRKKVVIHVWNNNPEIRNQVDETVNKIRARIEVIHSDVNLYSYSRFLHIRQAMQVYHMDYVIIVDDDEEFGHHYVERLYRERRPKVFRSWWGRQFLGGHYFDGVPNADALKSGKRRDILQFDYAGPGGCVIDAGIFLMKATYMIPVKFVTLDDLWLSYVVAMAGWKSMRTFVRPNFILDEETKKVALWYTLRNEKDEFLTYLRNGGWKV